MKMFNLLFSMLFIGACFASNSIIIKNGHIRKPPPGVDITAGYMDIEVKGRSKKLIKVNSAKAQAIEIHDHKKVNGMMKMINLKSLELKKGLTHFSPGGLHLMIFGLDKKLKDDKSFPVEFHFENEKPIKKAFFIK